MAICHADVVALLANSRFNHMLDTFDYDSKSKNEDDKVKDFFNEWIAFVSEFKEAFHRKVVLTVSGKVSR